MSGQYLKHIRKAWDQQFPDQHLADQDIVLTLPASFDEVARELTGEAASVAGLSRVVLIEEPQAAFTLGFTSTMLIGNRESKSDRKFLFVISVAARPILL